MKYTNGPNKKKTEPNDFKINSNDDLNKSGTSDYSHFNVDDDSESEQEFPDVIHNRTKNLEEMKNQYYDKAISNLRNNINNSTKSTTNMNINSDSINKPVYQNMNVKNYEKDLKNLISKYLLIKNLSFSMKIKNLLSITIRIIYRTQQ